jgi:hypothetical protein
VSGLHRLHGIHLSRAQPLRSASTLRRYGSLRF